MRKALTTTVPQKLCCELLAWIAGFGESFASLRAPQLKTRIQLEVRKRPFRAR